MGGPRHNGPEGWPEGLPIQASWRLKASGKQQNPLPFVGRFMGYVRLYGELQGGRGRREKSKVLIIADKKTYYIGTPTLLPSFQALPAVEVGRNGNSSARASVQAESGDSQSH